MILHNCSLLRKLNGREGEVGADVFTCFSVKSVSVHFTCTKLSPNKMRLGLLQQRPYVSSVERCYFPIPKVGDFFIVNLVNPMTRTTFISLYIKDISWLDLVPYFRTPSPLPPKTPSKRLIQS